PTALTAFQYKIPNQPAPLADESGEVGSPTNPGKSSAHCSHNCYCPDEAKNWPPDAPRSGSPTADASKVWFPLACSPLPLLADVHPRAANASSPNPRHSLRAGLANVPNTSQR